MPTDRDARDHDIVLFGATGFTGELTAAYLAEHAPEGLRWALAGRNQEKLEAVRDASGAARPELKNLPLLQADSSDDASLRALAESTRVVITTVGPYLQYGEPLVAACAAAGTDYVDLTGEPEFVDRMYLAHHDAAVALRRPHRARLRLRLDPARPRRLVHGEQARLDRPDHAARRRPGRWRCSRAAPSTPPSAR